MLMCYWQRIDQFKIVQRAS